MLPANFFDDGETICLSKIVFQHDCPGCGLTRGIQHLIHLDFAAAWEYNKLTIFVFPVLVFFWGKFTWEQFKKWREKSE